MPIEYRIDHERRIVFANGRGVMTDADFFGYQREVWSLSEVVGYHELVDMSAVERIELPSIDRMRALAALSARMDPPEHRTKFAIVASEDLAFGLGRMYEVFREGEASGRKEVMVFRTLDDALDWLGISGLD